MIRSLVLALAAVGTVLVGGNAVLSAIERGSTNARERSQGVSARSDASATASPLIGITWGSNVTWAMQRGDLVRVDPRTFRTLPGRRLALGLHGYSWAYSPDRSKLVVGGFASGLRFVDLERFEILGDVRENRRGGLVLAVAWPRPRRVLAVVQEPWGVGQLTLAVVDPVERIVLARRPLLVAAEAVAAARTKSGLVLLLAPFAKPRREIVGPPTLLHIDADGRTGSAVLDRISAGQEPVRPRSSPPVLRISRPGVAFDVSGRAFVVAGAAPVVAVDLRTMRVTYHELRQPISLLGRLRNWMEPEAQAKGETAGSVREARWVGDGLLAISGFDARGRQRSLASGLKLIETRTWAVRTLNRAAADFAWAQRLLLVYGCCWRTGGARLGLSAYDVTGKRLWHLFDGKAVQAVQVSGDRAYVRLEGT